jgi:tryptophan-rich sensory protein
VLFFRLHRPELALWGCIPLLGTIAGLLMLCLHADPVAALCLAPYLGWVAIATRLNADIVALNGPADALVGLVADSPRAAIGD